MSDDATPYEVVQGKILQLASAPFAPPQHDAWQARVNAAYRTLSQNADFRIVLQHWTVKVLLNPEADEGARKMVIEVLHFMNTQQQIALAGYHQEEGEARVW